MSQTTRKRGGRPRKPIKRERVNLTLHPEVHREAAKLAFQDNRSLSSLVELCLRREIARAKSAPASV
jgi:predicted HicB family RNase H-like nuclease